MPHIAFPSLDQFSSVLKRETKYSDKIREVSFGAKIKLHGMNAGIRVTPDGEVTAQSRKQDIHPSSKDTDFARFVDTQKDIWSRAKQNETIVFYGEWAGPNIQKGDAVHQVDKRRFYIFAIAVGVVPHPLNDQKFIPEWMITEPDAIKSMIPEGIDEDLVRILPWENDHHLDFRKNIEDEIDRLNEAVDRLAEEDPYIKREFGISSSGEGYVLVEKSDRPGILSGQDYGKSTFKVKTEKHRVRKQHKPAMIKSELKPGVRGFCEAYVTQPRLEQAISELGFTDDPDIKQTGQIIKWMMGDINKESRDDLAESDLTFKDVSAELVNSIRGLWMAYLDEQNKVLAKGGENPSP